MNVNKKPHYYIPLKGYIAFAFVMKPTTTKSCPGLGNAWLKSYPFRIYWRGNQPPLFYAKHKRGGKTPTIRGGERSGEGRGKHLKERSQVKKILEVTRKPRVEPVISRAARRSLEEIADALMAEWEAPPDKINPNWMGATGDGQRRMLIVIGKIRAGDILTVAEEKFIRVFYDHLMA